MNKRFISLFIILCICFISFHFVNASNNESGDFIIKNGTLMSYTGDDEIVILPESIIKIDNNVFKNNKIITKVVLPNSLISIGDHAFYDYYIQKNTLCYSNSDVITLV